jgi:RNA polymerase sigma-70 factor (ECF subfamily)
MDQVEETTLVQKLVTMDAVAWETFCREYSRPLFSFVRLVFGCRWEQAEEIVQMTFVRCVRSIQTFDASRGPVLAWLKAVARNEARTHLGSEARNPTQVPLSCIPRHVADQVLDALDRRPLPDEVLAREDVRSAIRDALLKLNTRHREVLICKYLEGMSMSEIASQFAISEKAVESILSRSRVAFRGVFIMEKRDQESPASEVPYESA